MSELVAFSVVYATCEHTTVAQFQLPRGSTLADALTLLQTSPQFPPPLLAPHALPSPTGADDEKALLPAIFGQRAQLTTPLYDGDRIELLPPLRCDPKESRRRRARSQR